MKAEKQLARLLTGFSDDAKITKITEHDHTVELFVNWDEQNPNYRKCPFCGSTHCNIKDSGSSQTIRHLPIGMKGSLITFHKPRLICMSCFRTFYIRPWWAAPGMSISLHLFFDIYKTLTSTTLSIRTIASQTKTSEAIVTNVIRHISLGKPSSLPQTLGIDEFKGQTGSFNRARGRYDVEKYHCVIVDADNGAVIDILKKTTFNELHDYFMQFTPLERRKVKYFCTDMRTGYSKVARACFPHAKICIDPFHVVKLVTDAVGSIRIDEWRRLRDVYFDYCKETQGQPDPNGQIKDHKRKLEKDYTFVKNSQKLLITSPYNEGRYWSSDKDHREECLKELFLLAPALEFPYEALMEFYAVTAEKNQNLRHADLSQWLDTYLHCSCPEIAKAARSIQQHRKNIENAWNYSKSNSPTEGINKRIKDVKRACFGAHDFENFRKRILLACGYINFIDPPYTIYREKLTSGDGSTTQTMQYGR